MKPLDIVTALREELSGQGLDDEHYQIALRAAAEIERLRRALFEIIRVYGEDMLIAKRALGGEDRPHAKPSSKQR